MSTSSSSVLITWGQPTIPNGIITQYTLYVNYLDSSPLVTFTTSNAVTEYILSGLEPYQLVVVQVSASTAVGEGPKSNATERRTNEEGMSPAAVLTPRVHNCYVVLLMQLTTSAAISTPNLQSTSSVLDIIY